MVLGPRILRFFTIRLELFSKITTITTRKNEIMVGLCLDYFWIMFGFMLGLCLDYAWIMLGLCLDYSWIMLVLSLDFFFLKLGL